MVGTSVAWMAVPSDDGSDGKKVGDWAAAKAVARVDLLGTSTVDR